MSYFVSKYRFSVLFLAPYADNQGNFYYENGGANNTSYQSTNHARTTSNTATTTKRATWQSMFQQLQHFYDRHGHIDVPKTSTLAFWSCSQRRQYRIYAGPEDGLPPHLKPRLLKEPKGIIKTRINQLNTLGFVWFVKTEATQTNVAFGSAATATRAVIPKSQEELRTTTTEPEDEAEPNETALAAMAKGGCGKCEVCVRPDVDCRECKFCLDMRKYGGPNVLRKRCLLRRKLCLVNFPQPVQKPRKSAKMPAKKRSTATNSSRRSGVRESIAVRKAKATAAKYLPPKKTRAPRGCGTCNVCLQPDCRKCKFCIDMRKYGGPNVLRKRCMHRLKCPVTSPQPIKLGIPPPALLREKKTVKRKAPEKQAATITVQTPRGRIRKISRKMQESYDPSGTGVTTTQPEAILDDEEDEEVAVEEEPHESEEEDGKPRYVNPSPRIKGQSFFPWQLFTMVTETTVDNPHILEWLPCGSAFRIHNQVRTKRI